MESIFFGTAPAEVFYMSIEGPIFNKNNKEYFSKEEAKAFFSKWENVCKTTCFTDKEKQYINKAIKNLIAIAEVDRTLIIGCPDK